MGESNLPIPLSPYLPISPSPHLPISLPPDLPKKFQKVIFIQSVSLLMLPSF